MIFKFMTSRIVIAGTASLLVIAGCTDNPVVPTETQVVLQGFLYANQPVQNIQLSTATVIESTDTAGPPIVSASVILTRNGTPYQLMPTPSQPGFYSNSGPGLTVASGDEFVIQVNYNGQIVSAETVIPPKPVQVSLSTSVLHFVPDTIQTRFGTRYSVVTQDSAVVSWANPTADYYYVVIESIDSSRQLLRPDSTQTRRFISQPTNQSTYRISPNSIIYTGTYGLILYRINKEYADLYRSRQQDSRALNEPLTNVKNGLGVFSGFASDTLSFSVTTQ